ncbi:hypothetical protein SPLC1_S300270 [Arthrospira platensis C1]|uniref:Uncharacterized protein n=3 Tax=Limnospira TaxID=2596745 RepID=A0A9P1KJY6_9CYAN|nr:hypothetical protein AmaxDRAFT_2722 [Limnospira maxima CS-328]EKD08007.1 hypothetical protein SPLC1_S300270 [Arthrospira platensis C1]UWU47038.1 hypothetical protein APLC1_1782 [Arthrospira platensis C1]CDM96952.1 conserved hypothetical protein [Limnospira indica PCC 8005]
MTYNHPHQTNALIWRFDLASELLRIKLKMLHRKIYQLCCDGREVCIFLRDQQRWIEKAHILDIEGDLVTLRYETEEDDEVSSWEEIVRLESIGSISQKLASVPRGYFELQVSDECPEAEQLRNPSTDSDRE